MALEAQNNPYPSILIAEHADPESIPDANPAAGYKRLVVKDDLTLWLLDDTGTATEIGGGAWNGGTSFPATPATGDRFWRSDLGLECYYDGTRWLTTQLFRESFGSEQEIPGTTNNGVRGRLTPWHTTYSLWLDTFYSTVFVLTTNDGSKYWTITASKEHAGLTTIATFNTSASSPGVWVTRATSIGAVYTAVSDGEFEVSATKTSTPGALYYAFSMSYRLIVT